ncbi:MAG: acetate--CoA ligase family protein [Acidimicrobiales bacterium]
MRLEENVRDASHREVVSRLSAFFGAKSVVLIGATDRSPWSLWTHANLRQYSPQVTVHVVHPHHDVVHGQPVLKSLKSLEEPVDLAYVMVPTSAVLEVMNEVADAGITNVVILTAGFGEAGPDGVALELQLVNFAHTRGLTVLGPNGNGFINAAGGLTPYSLLIVPPLDVGPVGIVLQSGGLASAVLTGAQARGLGLSLLVSTGNESLTSASDIMRYLIEDDQTKVIAAFLESVRQPDEFRDVCERALRAGKPIVALKTGRSEAGAKAALAHTGALAGDDRVVDAAFRQLGVIRVNTLEELLATAGYLGQHRRIRGRRIAAITPSGGACDLLADLATEEQLEFPEFPPQTLAALRQFLPSFSNPQNPLDVTGYVVMDPTISLKSMEIVGRDVAGNYDMMLYTATIPRSEAPNPAPIEERMDALAAASKTLAVPLILHSLMSVDLSPYQRKLLRDRGLFLLSGIEPAMRAIGHGARYHERRDHWLEVGPPSIAPTIEAPSGARGVWPEHLVRILLEARGIPVAPARLVATAIEARALAEEFGEPVAMKVASSALAHKSDIGGVALNVNVNEVMETFEELKGRLAVALPEATFDGVLVGPMRTGGLELLVGVVTDPTWGKVLSLGLGGVWVEVLGDVALRILPVGTEDITAMIGELKGAALLRGARGTRPVDMDRLVSVVYDIAQLAEGLGEALDTFEVNPLRVDGETVEVLDALALWRNKGD